MPDKKFYYAKTANKYAKIKTNSEYFKIQANPLNRYKLFFSNLTKLFTNPVVGLGMLFMKTSEFIVGALGFISRY